MKISKKRLKYDLGVIILIALFIAFLLWAKDQFGIFSNREEFQNFINSFGPLAPLAIIIVIIVEVIIAPLPGFLPGTVAGFLFGPIEGAIYTYIGNVIGSILVFILARKYGRFVVERIFDAKQIDKYEGLISRRRHFLFLFYFFPIFPADIVSVAFGLSDVNLKTFISFMSLGFISNVFFLNYLGDYLAKLYF